LTPEGDCATGPSAGVLVMRLGCVMKRLSRSESPERLMWNSPQRTINRVEVLIRPPQPGDVQGLVRAARDLAEQYAELEPDRFHVPEPDAVVAWYHDAFAKPVPENRVWLVAEVDGEPVGEAQAFMQEPATNAAVQPQRDVGRRRAYLNYLAVQAVHRRGGIGGRLMEAVEQWARENGAELIETDTNLRTNVGAVEFYERLGYVKQSVVLRKSLT
jgi:GNAT superfamily N-acetyltransferase